MKVVPKLPITPLHFMSFLLAKFFFFFIILLLFQKSPNGTTKVLGSNPLAIK
jgi:hypothetical protein